MRIAFDAKRAAQNRTGLGNYSRFVLDILDRHMPDGEFVLFAPNAKKTSLLQRFVEKKGKFSLVTPIGIWKLLRSLWRTFGITKDIEKANVALYHGLSNELPLNIRKAKCKSIVTVHDVIFRSFPQGYNAIDRWLYNFKYGRSCRNADHIIAVSEFTKQEIMRYYNIPSEKISVVYQGCDIQFRQAVDDEQKAKVRETYNLPEHYILYVGSIEERKNLLLLMKALTRLPKDTHVVACGKRTAYFDKVFAFVKEHGLEQQVLFVHNAEFKHLPAIYQMADVAVYPSRIEGFGIPMLEALCSGTPAIGCTGSCLEEAGGPGSLYVDPDDEDALTRCILDVVHNDNISRSMITAGRVHSDKFEEDRLAERLIEVYKKVLAL